jgi:Rod binding domain-containing protein
MTSTPATLPGATLAASRDKALTSSLNARMPTTANEAVAERTGREFEAMFLSQMLQPMFETVKTNDMFGGGAGEDAFKGILVDEYGKMIAKAGGVGIADQVKRQILDFQARQEAGKQIAAAPQQSGSVTLSVDAMRAAYKKAGAAEGAAPASRAPQQAAVTVEPTVEAAPQAPVKVQKLKG